MSYSGKFAATSANNCLMLNHVYSTLLSNLSFGACNCIQMPTLAPVAPSARAVALPIPLDPPVTKQTGASAPADATTSLAVADR